MTDFRKIAEKLEKRRVRFATFRAPKEDGIDISYRILARYPTITLLCCGLAVATATVIASWLIDAFHIINP